MRVRPVLVATAVLLAAGALSATGSPVATADPVAAKQWTLASVPLPTAPNGDVRAIGCTPDGAYCVEVGSFHDATGQQQPLAAHRTGTTWKRDTVPAVAAPAVVLKGVSCASPTACVAVGAQGSDLGDRFDHAVAYVWNGTRWSRSPLTEPSHSSATRLEGVSCATATACIAVGRSENDPDPATSLSYSYDGSGWTLRPVPAGDGLDAVSCTSPTACVGVGSDLPSPPGVIVAWNGSSWHRQKPAPNGSIGELYGVSCISAATCTAVGYAYDFDAGDLAVAQRLTGGHWVAETLPDGVTGLQDVSCRSGGTCVATATRQSGDKYEVGVVIRNSSGSWTFASVPTPSDDATLTGITCSAADACTVVGDSDGLPFVDRLAGGTWSSEPTVAPRGVYGSRLDGVSCTNATACTAVGRYGEQYASLALIERWDGHTWTRQSVPDRAGSPFTELTDVSCPTVTACVAVGEEGDDNLGISVPRPVIARWTSAGGWVTVPTPSPGVDGSLSAVSCAATTSCVAVGYQYNGNGVLTYVLSGTTWKSKTVPLPTGVSNAALTGVSCPKVSACHAVGGSFPDDGTQQHVDVLWNGSAWSVGRTVGKVDAVSCTGQAACTAVGTADADDQHVVAQRLANGTWSARPTPNPGNGTSYLRGVSCTTTTCTAVGASSSPLVFRGPVGGTWVRETTATPNGDGSLQDVACGDATHCVAVGTYGSAGVIEVRTG